MDDIKHTANFLASSFFGTKLSLKYKLKNIHWAIIRYLCDCIDKNYKIRKKFEIKIYQSQISKFTFLSRKTINKEIKFLIKKRIIKLIKKNVYCLGKLLYACNLRLQKKEVSPRVTDVRSVTVGYISNSSNSTNKSFPLKTNNQNQKANLASVDNQSTSYQKKDIKRTKPPEEEWKEALKSVKQKSKINGKLK